MRAVTHDGLQKYGFLCITLAFLHLGIKVWLCLIFPKICVFINIKQEYLNLWTILCSFQIKTEVVRPPYEVYRVFYLKFSDSWSTGFVDGNYLPTSETICFLCSDCNLCYGKTVTPYLTMTGSCFKFSYSSKIKKILFIF